MPTLYSVKKPEQKTILAGRIARAAAVFCVDEIVIFDDDPSNIPANVDRRYHDRKKTKQEVMESISEQDELWQNPDQFLFHTLSYAECPPYLRGDLFGEHQNLRWMGIFPSLDLPHHMKASEWMPYREGMSLGPAAPDSRSQSNSSKKRRKSAQQEEPQYSYVECGLPYPVVAPGNIPQGMRVTLKFASGTTPPPNWPYLDQHECETLVIEPVELNIPREERGYYWGYSVRKAPSLSAVFTECPWEEGYCFSVGTSERGVPLDAVLPDNVAAPAARKRLEKEGKVPPVKLPKKIDHMLVVFGGVPGLEPAIMSDPVFREKGLTGRDADKLFDAWVNLVPNQGSRTIRTEEAVEFGLFGLKGYMDSLYER